VVLLGTGAHRLAGLFAPATWRILDGLTAVVMFVPGAALAVYSG